MNPQIYNLSSKPLRKKNALFFKVVILLLSAALIAVILLAAYKNFFSVNGPEAVIEKMEKAINDGDFDTLLSCLTPHEQAAYKAQFGIAGIALDIGTDLFGLPGISLDSYTDLMGALFASQMGSQYVKLEVISTVYNSTRDEAELTVKICLSNESEEEIDQISMIKISGEWYINEHIIESADTDTLFGFKIF